MDTMQIIYISLITIGIVIQILDKYYTAYKNRIKNNPILRAVLLCLSIVLITINGVLVLIPICESQRYEVYASPSEINVRQRTNKDLVLKITNNKDYAIYDVSVSVCINDINVNPDIIDIMPAEVKEDPNIPFILVGYVLSNGCSTFSFHSISPHSTRDFHIRVKHENNIEDHKIAFIVYDWALEPSLFDVPITNEQFRNIPKNFHEFYEKKEEGIENRGHAWLQRIKIPQNPYFPCNLETKLISVRYYKR